MYLSSSHLSVYVKKIFSLKTTKMYVSRAFRTLEYGPAIEVFPSRSNTLYVILFAFPRRTREPFSVP